MCIKESALSNLFMSNDVVEQTEMFGHIAFAF